MEAMMQSSRDDQLECLGNRRRLLKLLGCAGVALAALALGSTAKPARAADGRTIVVTGTQPMDTLVTAGCLSPVGFCTGGPITGNKGFQGGTDTFTQVAPTEPIPGDPFGRQTVEGLSTYTTKKGSIIIRDVSVLDPVRNTFAGTGRIVGGTGEFAGATGNDFTFGHLNPDGSFFTTFEIDLTLP
jgi:hypothetical protein